MDGDEAQEYLRQIHDLKPTYQDIRTACRKVKIEVAGKMEAFNRLLV